MAPSSSGGEKDVEAPAHEVAYNNGPQQRDDEVGGPDLFWQSGLGQYEPEYRDYYGQCYCHHDDRPNDRFHELFHAGGPIYNFSFLTSRGYLMLANVVSQFGPSECSEASQIAAC